MDWTGTKYIRIDIDWNYEKSEVKTAMHGYVQRALKAFQHQMSTKPVNGPTPYTQPTYGKQFSMHL